MTVTPKPHTTTPAMLLLTRAFHQLFFDSVFVSTVTPIEPNIGSGSSIMMRFLLKQLLR